MKAIIRKICLFLSLTLLLPAALANAATLIRYVPDPLPDDGKLYNNLNVYVAPEGVVLTGRTRDDTEYTVWFDAQDGVFRILDPRRGGYFALRVSDAESFRREQDELLASIEERVAQAEDEEKREAIRNFGEQMEKRLYGGGLPEAPEYEAAGESTIEGRACREYVVSENQETDHLLCAADYESLGLNEATWNTLSLMADTALRLRRSVSRFAAFVPRFALDLNQGVPVLIEYYQGTEVRRKLKLQEVESWESEPEILAGYESLRQLPAPGFN